jgi:hypothetical protein
MKMRMVTSPVQVVASSRRKVGIGCDMSLEGVAFRLRGMDTHDDLRPLLFSIAYRT